MASIRRGDVVLVRLDPGTGAEVRKTRPAVVVSNNASNDVSPIVTIIPLTTSVRRVYPFEVRIPKKATGREAKAMGNQIRTVSKQRVLKKLGALDGVIMARIEDAVLVHLDIER